MKQSFETCRVYKNCRRNTYKRASFWSVYVIFCQRVGNRNSGNHGKRDNKGNPAVCVTRIVMYVQYMKLIVSCVVLPSFDQNWISRQILVKTQNVRFSRKSVLWEPICSVRTERQADRQADGRTDGPTEMTKLTFRRKVLLCLQAVCVAADSPVIYAFRYDVITFGNSWL